MGYVSKQGLENLPKYKSSETLDHSILYHSIISPVCNVLVGYLPLWLAPNLITVIGMLCNVLGFILAVLFIGVGTEDSTMLRYISFVNGILIFSNMMLDNMDGKQARRTKTSSPLGELVDHGCDSLFVGLGAMMTGMITGSAPVPILVFFALCGLTFYSAHWEEYFTHSLELGAIGPVETQVILTFFHVLTFFVGRPWWSEVMSIGGYQVTRTQLVMIAFLIGSVYTTGSSMIAGLLKATRKGISASFALSQLLPLTISYLAGALWVCANYALFEENSLLFITTFGLLFSFLVIRCIIERICNEPFRLFYKIMAPLLVACVNASFHYFSRSPPLPEKIVLLAVFAIMLGGWLHMAYYILEEFCMKLKIAPFTIPVLKNK
eukprot:Phypoly_transcript_11889.p1 GENE.Phypoly_transcript_11889~~Phypoly_transcript_11889.p1  ORF type:complete len:391 (+),score=32.14 Phypoly_transcript_11889:39-1175(+)